MIVKSVNLMTKRSTKVISIKKKLFERDDIDWVSQRF